MNKLNFVIIYYLHQIKEIELNFPNDCLIIISCLIDYYNKNNYFCNRI